MSVVSFVARSASAFRKLSVRPACGLRALGGACQHAVATARLASVHRRQMAPGRSHSQGVLHLLHACPSLLAQQTARSDDLLSAGAAHRRQAPRARAAHHGGVSQQEVWHHPCGDPVQPLVSVPTISSAGAAQTHLAIDDSSMDHTSLRRPG